MNQDSTGVGFFNDNANSQSGDLAETVSDGKSVSIGTNNLVVINNNKSTSMSSSSSNNITNGNDNNGNINALGNNNEEEDMENDPDTDNEQHARSQILRTRARANSHSNSNKTNSGRNPSLVQQNYGGPISSLPPEMLCLIFSYIHSKPDLISIALSCKYWADLIISIIWFRPGINNKHIFAKLEKTMKTPANETMWNYRKFIKRLNLSLIPNLVTDDFLNLFVGCTNLERITLVNCSKITHESISALLEGCSRLQSIDLTGVTDIQDDIYMQLSMHCKRLQGLYAPGSSCISQEAVLNLIYNCPLLKRVKLSDCNSITDDVVQALVKNCPSLVELDLHGCEQVTNKSLHMLFLQLESLKEFKISKNQNITYECFDSPNGSILCLDKLRILDFTQCSNITDKAVIKFIQLAPKLRNVVLSKCSSITDASLRAIATLGKNLHYVHLGHCSNITDAGAKELIKNCYRLQYIDLACCNQLTNATVVELSNLPKLRRIGLVKCSQITDEGILALAENSRNADDTLERVHLSYCVNLTIYPIYRLLRACPKLTHISLTGISQFLRPDITRFCREPPSEFNPHQKSIFCVFSGEGVNLLRNHLNHLIQTTEVEDREATEILQIINGIIGTTTPANMEQFSSDQARERFEHFVSNAMDFLHDYDGIAISIETMKLFARCIFGGIQQTQATRVQRFFQLMHDRPARTRMRGRYRQLQLQQQQQQQQQERDRLRELELERLRARPRILATPEDSVRFMLELQARNPIPEFHGSVLENEIINRRYRTTLTPAEVRGREEVRERERRFVEEDQQRNIEQAQRQGNVRDTGVLQMFDMNNDEEPEGRQYANIPPDAAELFREDSQDIDEEFMED